MSEGRTATAPVPVVDVAGLRSADPEVRAAAAAEVGRACEEVGFLTVVGHGLAPEVLEAAFAAGDRFFAQPPEVKERVGLADGVVNRGYDGPGSQQLDPDSPAADQKEVYDIGLELDLDHPLVAAGTPMHGPNPWPDLPGFREPVEAVYDAMRDVAEMLLRGMALSLGLPEDRFAEAHRTPIASLRLLRYPPRPDDADEAWIGAGAHSDWGAVTVLAQDDVGGLEVQLADGSWSPVPPRPGALVVNIGDLLARWTNDRYRSTRHRVVGAPGRVRRSIVFFLDLDWHARIEVLPECLAPGEVPRYGPTTPGEHLTHKFNESMGLLDAADVPADVPAAP